MPRYIDAENFGARLRAVAERSLQKDYNQFLMEETKSETAGLLRAIEILNSQPTADVEPINTTRETPMPIMFETEEYDAHGEHYRITKPYCPNCNHIFYAAFGDKQDCINDYRVKRKVVPIYCPKCGQALDWSEIAGVSLD